MSNTVINWRFGAYHLQVVRWGDWRSMIRAGGSPITWGRNGYHAPGGPGRAAQGWTWIALYEGRRYALLLALIAATAIWFVA